MKNKTRGLVMILAGFFMILINALTYFIRDSTQPAVGIIGLVFVLTGMNISKRK
jgi:hypothetical protein